MDTLNEFRLKFKNKDIVEKYTLSELSGLIESLASCAIEGNELAIGLLELTNKDFIAFLWAVEKYGFLNTKGK